MLHRRIYRAGRAPADALWESIPQGAAIWRALRHQLRARGACPPGWSWPDWLEEVEAASVLRAHEAPVRFEPARGVPTVKFLYIELRNAVREHHRRECAFRRRHMELGWAVEPVGHRGNMMPEDAATVRQAFQALPSNDRRLLERLVCEGGSEVELACELGVSQSTVSRQKHKALERLRAHLESREKNL
jgi:RNA polymerase sigma factor (sigma-70 family)